MNLLKGIFGKGTDGNEKVLEKKLGRKNELKLAGWELLGYEGLTDILNLQNFCKKGEIEFLDDYFSYEKIVNSEQLPTVHTCRAVYVKSEKYPVVKLAYKMYLDMQKERREDDIKIQAHELLMKATNN